MNRIIFTNEINKIYERVYTINESLSVYESKEFLRGFNDGIREGAALYEAGFWNKAANWAGKKIGQATKGVENVVGDVKQGVKDVVDDVKQGYQNVKQGATNLYNKGKNLAKKVWTSIEEFSKSVYDKVSKGFDDVATFIATTPEKISDYLSNLYNQVAADINSAYEALKDKGKELLDKVSEFWTKTILPGIKKNFEAIKTTLLKDEKQAKAWFERNKKIVEKKATEFANSSIQFIKDAGTEALKILKQIGDGSLKVLKGVGILAALLVFGPIYLLIKGIMELPELYKAIKPSIDNGINALKEFWIKEKQAFMEGLKQGELGVSDRQVNFSKDDTKSLINKFKNSKYAEYKDQIKNILTKRGVAFESKYIKSFEDFNYKE